MLSRNRGARYACGRWWSASSSFQALEVGDHGVEIRGGEALRRHQGARLQRGRVRDPAVQHVGGVWKERARDRRAAADVRQLRPDLALGDANDRMTADARAAAEDLLTQLGGGSLCRCGRAGALAVYPRLERCVERHNDAQPPVPMRGAAGPGALTPVLAGRGGAKLGAVDPTLGQVAV